MRDLDAADLAQLGSRPDLSSDEAEQIVAAVSEGRDAKVRAVAVSTVARHAESLSTSTVESAWRAAVSDADPGVRRRAAEVAPLVAAVGVDVGADLARMVRSDEVLVAEAAAFALGELTPSAVAVDAVGEQARHHEDPLVREACVAALGSLGDPASLPAVLAGLSDRPPVRRRAVLALAAFDGPEVEAALHTALNDRDWQVRQAAEDLLA